MASDIDVALKNAQFLGMVGKPIPIDSYRKFLVLRKDGEYTVSASRNWQGIAVVCDALNILNKKPHLFSLDELLGWSEWFLNQQLHTEFGWMNHEQDSLIYLRHHVFFVSAIRAIGESLWNETLVDLCSKWLLVLAVHMACVTAQSDSLELTPEDSKKSGPGVFVTKVRPKDPFRAVCLCGERCESTKDGDINFDHGYWDEYIIDVLSGRYPVYGKYHLAWGISNQDREDLSKVCSRDVDALRRLISKIKDVRCKVTCNVEWTTEGINVWCDRIPDNSTAGKNFHIYIESTGESRIGIANSGARDGSGPGEQVGPTRTTVSFFERTLEAYREDLPGQRTGQAKMAGGDRIAMLHWGLSGHSVQYPPVSVPAPPSGGDDGKEEDDELSLWEKIVKFLKGLF